MAAESIIALLETAAVKEGTTLLDDHKAAIEAEATGLADTAITKVVSAVNSRLTDGGLDGLVEGKLKSMDVAAEPSMEAGAKAQIDSLLDAIETAATSALARLTGGSS